VLASSSRELVGRDDVGHGRGESKNGAVERGGEVGTSVRFEEEEVVVEVGGGGADVPYRVDVGFDGEAEVGRTREIEKASREKADASDHFKSSRRERDDAYEL